VSEFKYFGHMINDKLSDDDDIKREIRSLFVRSNILLRRLLWKVFSFGEVISF